MSRDSETLLFEIDSMRNMMTFDLELGPDYELWQDDWLYLRVCLWEPDTVYDLSDMATVPFTQVVRSSLGDTVEQLENKIMELIGLTRVVILLRHESVGGGVRCEYFNLDWRKQKKLKDCSKFTHGYCLFVEDSDPAQAFDLFKWK